MSGKISYIKYVQFLHFRTKMPLKVLTNFHNSLGFSPLQLESLSWNFWWNFWWNILICLSRPCLSRLCPNPLSRIPLCRTAARRRWELPAPASSSSAAASPSFPSFLPLSLTRQPQPLSLAAEASPAAPFAGVSFAGNLRQWFHDTHRREFAIDVAPGSSVSSRCRIRRRRCCRRGLRPPLLPKVAGGKGSIPSAFPSPSHISPFYLQSINCLLV